MTSASLRSGQRLDNAQAELIATAAAGISVGNQVFEHVVAGLRSALLDLAAPQQVVALGVPPVVSRALLERFGYIDGFPNLVGTVHSFTGDTARWNELQAARAEDGTPWYDDQLISEVALLPATCHHVYPMVEGEDLPEPVVLTAEAYCYRHEGTQERGRLRSFRMREFVRLGSPDDCLKWRDEWVERQRAWLTDLGLDVAVEPASDPFFGTAARLMRATQREQELKWEMRVPVGDGLVQAVASSNYHKEHFGEPFAIKVASEAAHSACAAFGLERIALALLAAHGTDPTAWPTVVRARLWPAGDR